PGNVAWIADRLGDTEEAFRLYQLLKERRKGRPVTKRQVAVDALDMRLTTKLSWGQIADKLCLGIGHAPCELRQNRNRHQNNTPCCQAIQESSTPSAKVPPIDNLARLATKPRYFLYRYKIQSIFVGCDRSSFVL